MAHFSVIHYLPLQTWGIVWIKLERVIGRVKAVDMLQPILVIQLINQVIIIIIQIIIQMIEIL